MKDDLSLYVQLANSLEKQIQNKIFKPGDKITPELELMKQYSCSRFTVREAIKRLVEKGILEKKQGVGTFVKESGYTQSLLQFYSLSEEMKKVGKLPSSKLMSFIELKKTPEEIRNKLDLDIFDSVFRIERLRLADDEVIMYEITYLPKKMMLNLNEDLLKNKQLYAVLEEIYGIKITKAREKFTAVIPPREVKEILELDTISACMRFERVSFMNKIPIEFTISYSIGDKMSFEIELN